MACAPGRGSVDLPGRGEQFRIGGGTASVVDVHQLDRGERGHGRVVGALADLPQPPRRRGEVVEEGELPRGDHTDPVVQGVFLADQRRHRVELADALVGQRLGLPVQGEVERGADGVIGVVEHGGEQRQARDVRLELAGRHRPGTCAEPRGVPGEQVEQPASIAPTSIGSGVEPAEMVGGERRNLEPGGGAGRARREQSEVGERLEFGEIDRSARHRLDRIETGRSVELGDGRREIELGGVEMAEGALERAGDAGGRSAGREGMRVADARGELLDRDHVEPPRRQLDAERQPAGAPGSPRARRRRSQA